MSFRNLLGDNLNTVELGLSHYTAKEMRDYCYSIKGEFFWITAYKFTFVRNPFDWVVSLYEFIKNNPTHPNFNEINGLSFEDFCVWNVTSIKNKKQNSNGAFNTLTDFVFDDKEILVDFYGKIENYDNDAKIICDRLKIPFIKTPHLNENKKRDKDYRKYYNEKSKQIITDCYYYDLVNFNYKF